MSATRQLAAILFADIQGYTALMQENEVKANLLREKLKKILEQEVTNHNGRVLKLSGDGALCIFNSAIQAVHSAIAIQKEMLQEPKVPLRIGIHTGDVMFEENDVCGDGVNVASRIESFAVAGGIFISGKVHDDIKNQEDISAISLGKYELKNVSAPVEIFAISNQGFVVPKKETLEGKGKKHSGKKFSSRKILMSGLALALIALGLFFYNKSHKTQFTGKEKSIAVLPFTNMSDDKDNEYFSDGITEDIITRLSQITGLKVIARTSVMRFKNSTESVKQIASDLGVSSILEGTVQKIGNKVRISAQLIDAGTDENLWADKYDRELKDIFQVQSDVSEVIALHLNASLTELQKSRIEKKPTENLEAYNLYLQGNYLWNKHTDESLEQAFDLYGKVIKLDSNFAEAYAAKAITAMSRVGSDFNPELMRLCAKRAIYLDSNLALAHTALGEYSDDRTLAMKEYDKAIELDPNYAHAWTYKGILYYDNGEFDKALPIVSQALILDPLSPIRMADKARILSLLGQKSEAIELIGKAERLEPEMNALPDRKLTVYFNAGEFDTWMQIAEGYYKSNNLSYYVLLRTKALYYAAKGDKQKSISMRDSCRILNGSDDFVLIAGCQNLLNEKEQAFKTLKDGIASLPANQIRNVPSYLVESSFGKLFSDRQFDEIKKQIGWKPLP